MIPRRFRSTAGRDQDQDVGPPSLHPPPTLGNPGSPARGWVVCQVGNFELNTDWNIEPGEVLALFGPSGAGKTTTLRAIAGLLRPRQGRIEIGGRVVYDDEGREWVPPTCAGLGI